MGGQKIKVFLYWAKFRRRRCADLPGTDTDSPEDSTKLAFPRIVLVMME
jgi:hypothetical protein